MTSDVQPPQSSDQKPASVGAIVTISGPAEFDSAAMSVSTIEPSSLFIRRHAQNWPGFAARYVPAGTSFPTASVPSPNVTATDGGGVLVGAMAVSVGADGLVVMLDGIGLRSACSVAAGSSDVLAGAAEFLLPEQAIEPIRRGMARAVARAENRQRTFMMLPPTTSAVDGSLW